MIVAGDHYHCHYPYTVCSEAGNRCGGAAAEQQGREHQPPYPYHGPHTAHEDIWQSSGEREGGVMCSVQCFISLI